MLQLEKEKKIREAEEVVEAVKKDCLEITESLDWQIRSLESDRRRVAALEKDLSDEIRIRADRLVSEKTYSLNREYQIMKEKLKEKYENLKLQQRIFIIISLLYGILVTFFQAVKSKELREQTIEFLLTSIDIIKYLAVGLWKVGTFFGRISEMISNETAAIVVRWTVQLVTVIGIVAGVGLLLWKIVPMAIKHVKKHMKDRITLGVLLGAMAVIVFFGEVLLQIVPINLILLFLLTMATYLSVRGVITMENENAKSNIGIGVYFIAVIAAMIGMVRFIYAIR